MNIEVYKDASTMSEERFLSLVDTQIECWWVRPFDEYLICKDYKCRALFSIEDVHWNIDNFRKEKWKKNDFECEECWNETEEIYEKEKFLKLLKEYFKWEVSCVLSMYDWKMEGFWLLTKTTVSSIIDYELATRQWSYNKEELLKQISKKIYWIDDALNEIIIMWNNLFIWSKYRKQNNSFKLLKKLFNLNKNYSWIPLILETRYDTKFYPLWKNTWFKNLLNDKYWYIVQYLKFYSEFLNFFAYNNSFFPQENSALFLNIQKIKNETLTFIEKNPNFSKRKFYK